MPVGFSVEKAHRLQLRLSKQIVRQDTLPKNLRTVAGVDVAYVDEWAIGVAVVLEYRTLAVVETVKTRVKADFPYIPTLLSFREAKPAKAAAKKLKAVPDVILVDAQGIAHPYRLGFASHLGLLLDRPTIGVAKSLLVGEVGHFNSEGWAPMVDKGELIGAAVRKNELEKPVYVSIGHKVSLERAIKIVQHCIKTGRVPEPTRMAHNVATEEKMKYKHRLKQRSHKEQEKHVFASSTAKNR